VHLLLNCLLPAHQNRRASWEHLGRSFDAFSTRLDYSYLWNSYLVNKALFPHLQTHYRPPSSSSTSIHSKRLDTFTLTTFYTRVQLWSHWNSGSVTNHIPNIPKLVVYQQVLFLHLLSLLSNRVRLPYNFVHALLGPIWTIALKRTNPSCDLTALWTGLVLGLYLAISWTAVTNPLSTSQFYFVCRDVLPTASRRNCAHASKFSSRSDHI